MRSSSAHVARLFIWSAALSLGACVPAAHATPDPQVSVAADENTSTFWRNASVYFLLTDRFHNGDRSNDHKAPAGETEGLLRGFEGGDIRGVTKRIREGYFNALGIDAIWTTPLIENVRGSVLEGEWGRTYAYHGYWPRDFTKVDRRLGSEADLAEMIGAAHDRGLRVIVDVILNHSGPVTSAGDPRWPAEWVRPSEQCTHKNFAGSTSCELSFTLQDFRTESDAPVEVPAFLIEQWRAEGRLQKEMAELDAFFARTGYPRAPKYHLVKWLTDWVRDYGVDGFRADTAKHVEPELWAVLKREAEIALADWRSRNSERIQGDLPFYMVGEVYNFGLSDFSQARGRYYDYGDRRVDFYANGFDALINMGFPSHSGQPLADHYAAYAKALSSGDFAGRGILSYIATHDDMNPLDPERRQARANATRLMLSPGGVQIYYGDEVARSLVVAGTKGDATLRSVLDWNSTSRNSELLGHWRRLGQFRKKHPAVGAGRHAQLSAAPYVFTRTIGGKEADRVVVALGLAGGPIRLPVGDTFTEGTRVRDAYTGVRTIIRDGHAKLSRTSDVVLLELSEVRR